MKHFLNNDIINIAENNSAVRILSNKTFLLIVSAVLALTLIIAPFFLWIYEKNNSDISNPQDSIFNNISFDDTPKVYITAEEYEQITNGMNYQEVCKIIGGDGVLIQTVDLGLGESFITTIYEWKIEDDELAFANVVFKNGVVISKSQQGITA